MCVGVCVCMLRPEIYIKCLPLLLLNLELIDLSTLTGQHAPGDLLAPLSQFWESRSKVWYLSSVPPAYTRHLTKSSP